MQGESGASVQRYSDERLDHPFTATVFLSRPVRFSAAGLVARLRAAWPAIGWDDPADAAAFVDAAKTCSVALAGPRSEHGTVLLVAMPGPPLLADAADLADKARMTFPEAAEVIAATRAVISVVVPSAGRSVAARFDAARRATLIAAELAREPAALAVHWPAGDTLVAPARWAEAAATAVRGEVPVLKWMAFVVEAQQDGTTPAPVTVSTIGCAAFNGHEVLMPTSRVEAMTGVRYVASAVRMMLERGHQFRDGETLGFNPDPAPWRVRHVVEGRFRNQTDTCALVPPSFIFDEIAFFGPRAMQPAPDGTVRKERGDPMSLRNRLYAFVAGGRGR